MTNTELLAQCKLNMRITSTSFDSEINQLISEAQTDISNACDSTFDADSNDDCRMVILYVKGLFGNGDERAWTLYKERLANIGTRKINDTEED